MPTKPKPKFRVGQVVMAQYYHCERPVQVRGYINDGMGGNRIETSGGYEFSEATLRPLTKLERGPEPKRKVVKRGK